MYLRYSNEFKQEPKNKRKKNKTRKPKIPKEYIKTRNFGFLIKKLDKPKLRKKGWFLIFKDEPKRFFPFFSKKALFILSVCV